MGLYDFTFYDLIRRNAVCFAERPAWLEAADGRTLTFAQYKAAVDRLAGGLLRSGVKKGDRIGVLGKNSLEYFLLYGAAAATGAILVPINWRLSPPEMVFNLNDCTPGLCFVAPEYHDVIREKKTDLVSVEGFSSLSAASDGFAAFGALSAASDLLPPVELSDDDGFVIIHTAAVAGRPRGALLSHGNLLCASLHMNYCFSLTPQDVHLNLLPLFHVAGLFMAVNAFHAGALNVNLPRFDAETAVQLIEKHGVSLLFDFSPILTAILDQHETNGTDLRSLKKVMGLDTPETIERYQQLTGGTFYSMYGQTETACLATFGTYDECPGSAGRCIPLGLLELVDDSDNPVASGEVGEITLKGPMVFKGYWNLEADTALTFRNGRHHTGDLGRIDENGFLFYAGRKPEKELIKPGGENVYPAEVEAVILQHPAIDQTVVFGVPDPKWKEGIKAVCRLHPDQALEAADLIRFVGERIASFKKPQYVEFVSDFPTAPDGSPDREKIKGRYGGTAVKPK